jgi:O-antigen ligase
MLIILLALPVFLVFEEVLLHEKNKTRNMITLAAMLAASFLTFSKTILLVFLGIILLYLHHRLPTARKYRPVLMGGIAVLFILSAHFLFFRTNSSWNEKLKDTPFTTNEILFSNDQVMILESFYLFAKRCALAVGQQNPVVGVGPGNFNQALDNLDEVRFGGLKKLKNFDPHSTYFGGLAETGTIGLLSILLLFYFAIKKLNVLFVQSPKAVWYCLLVVIQIFLIEGISTDIMNFRNLWVILGIISGIPPYAPDQGSAFTPPLTSNQTVKDNSPTTPGTMTTNANIF